MIFLDVLYILILILYIPLNPRFLFKKEYRKILKGRFSPGISRDEKGSIWIHAVSVGEVKSLESFISLLRAKTGKRIILSVTTPSGYRIAREIFKDIEIVNGPFDLSFVVKKFIQRINPSIIVLNELEIWPNWISIADRMDIPMVVINGRISDPAFKSYKRFSFILKRFFRKIDLFLLQEQTYIEKFTDLGVEKQSMMISGNIKADEAVIASGKVRTRKKIFEFLAINKPGKKILLFASTHLSDENVFIPTLQELIKKYYIIIAPRHMNRVSDMAGAIKKTGIKFRIWSTDQPSDKDILIFDKMGYLTELIKISDLVFMGGSFDPAVGGHNLYEPAVFGKKIVGGPCYNNFKSIGNELVQNRSYTIAEDSESVTDFLMNINEEAITGSAGAAEGTVLKRSGAIEFSIREVLKFLN